MSPELSVAVNAYKSPELVRQCLQALERHLPESGVAHELIVADSATEEPTRRMMRDEYPHVGFLPHADNVGYGGLVRASLAAARGEYVFLINADVEIGPETVPALLAYARAHPEAGIVGPRQYDASGDLLPTAFRFYRPRTILYRRTPLGRSGAGRRHLQWFEMAAARRAAEPIAVDWLMGSALFVSQANAARIGPMDPRFFMYFEDVDWARRAWEAGLRVVYHPGATVRHLHKRESAGRGPVASVLFNPLTRMHIASAGKYFLKYRGRKSPVVR